MPGPDFPEKAKTVGGSCRTARRLNNFTIVLALRAVFLLPLLVTATVLTPRHLSSQELPDTYPEARRTAVVDTVAGHPVPDPYGWLENPTTPEVQRWINEQNDLSTTVLRSLPMYDSLYRRVTEATFRASDIGRPRWRDGRLYYTKRSGGKERTALYVRDGLGGEEKVVLAPSEVSTDPTVTISFEGFEADGRYLVYAVRQGGEDETTIKIRDRKTGRLLPDSLPRADYGGLSFNRDDTGFYYVRSFDRRPPRAYYHELGSSVSEDTLVFEGKEREDWISVEPVRDGRNLMATVGHGWRSTDIYLKDLRQGGGWEPLVEGLDALSSPRWIDGKLWLLTEHGAPKKRLVEVDPENPEPENWEEILPEREEVLDSYTLVNGRIWARYLTDSVGTRIRIFQRDGTEVRDLELPGKGTASLPWKGPGGRLFFTYESFFTPRTIYLYDPETTERWIWYSNPSPVSTEDWVVELSWVRSADGVRVPVHIVHERGLKRSGDNPTLLHGYGGFNAAKLPQFSYDDRWQGLGPIPALFVEAGGVYALAHLRGGGEFGQRWHWQGMLSFKQNVFNDFIAIAEYLHREEYSRPETLAIQGGSNGGLLVGAAMTQRPDLFGAVVANLPELDLVGYPCYDNINPPALDEYGDASIPEEYDWIADWSPLQNVERGTEYPSVFLATGDMDTRVAPIQARKMAATLQWATASEPEREPVILLNGDRVGHAGGRPASEWADFLARELAYLDWQLGGPWTK